MIAQQIEVGRINGCEKPQLFQNVICIDISVCMKKGFLTNIF